MVLNIKYMTLKSLIFKNAKGNYLNNCNNMTNGEHDLYKRIKDNINTIFDVGCRTDSDFISFKGNCHYFDPCTDFIEKISKLKNENKTSKFNAFGLGEKQTNLWYYPRYQSFYNRIKSCEIDDDKIKYYFKLKLEKSI